MFRLAHLSWAFFLCLQRKLDHSTSLFEGVDTSTRSTSTSAMAFLGVLDLLVHFSLSREYLGQIHSGKIGVRISFAENPCAVNDVC
jgi:hypothetical protein